MRDLDAEMRASRERRKQHPDWPSHKPYLIEPNGRKTVYETMPTGKADISAYCKYCYTTHADWWRMDDPEPVFLCGQCEHTSLIERTAS